MKHRHHGAKGGAPCPQGAPSHKRAARRREREAQADVPVVERHHNRRRKQAGEGIVATAGPGATTTACPATPAATRLRLQAHEGRHPWHARPMGLCSGETEISVTSLPTWIMGCDLHDGELEQAVREYRAETGHRGAVAARLIDAALAAVPEDAAASGKESDR